MVRGLDVMNKTGEISPGQSSGIPTLRDVSQEDLEKILENHLIWLESYRKEGARADLRAARLDLIDLSEAKLQKANFDFAVLEGANFWEADLQWASFRGADLRGANLE